MIKLSSLSLVLLLNASWAACVQTRVASLFAKPQTSSKKTWEATIYTPLKIKKMQSAWVSVTDLDQKAHWIAMKDLTNQYECATVKVEKSIFYKKVNEAFEAIENLPIVRTTSFKVISKEQEWLHVEDAQGNTYWASKKDFWIPVDPKPKSEKTKTAPVSSVSPSPVVAPSTTKPKAP